jgi:penicillin-binding protein 1B
MLVPMVTRDPALGFVFETPFPETTRRPTTATQASERPVARSRSLARLRRWCITIGIVAVVGIVSVSSILEIRRFRHGEALRKSVIYASNQTLGPGTDVEAIDLRTVLRRLGYVEIGRMPKRPGTFRATPESWVIVPRRSGDVPSARGPIRVDLLAGRVTRMFIGGTRVDSVAVTTQLLAYAGERHGERYLPVTFAEIPPSLKNALLASEDHRFFSHVGIEPRALARAAWANLLHGRIVQGGSTITQQLVKNRLLAPDRTVWRKLREMWLALLLERLYSKRDIFEAYANEIYLGEREGVVVRGVGTAALAYFGKPVTRLTVAESALLAGLVPAPNRCSPHADVECALRRRRAVLTRMLDLGMLGAAEWAAAEETPIKLSAYRPTEPVAPYFRDHIRRDVDATLRERAPASGRRIVATLDLQLQEAAEDAVARGLAKLEAANPRLRREQPTDRLQAALVAVDTATGEIRAYVGGRDYATSAFDRASQARRQPGSAFKPFVYATGMTSRAGRARVSPTSVVDDSPIALWVDTKVWRPRNAGERYLGPVTVRQAFEQSLNAATIRLAKRVGYERIVETARDFGIESRLEPSPMLALGAFEVTPLELARAYLPFANGGFRVPRLCATRAGDCTVPTARREPVLRPEEAKLMTSLLAGVVKNGTARIARGVAPGVTVAGKTGTTNAGRDAWFVGYTPTLLAVVWVGFDSGEPHRLSGAEAALPIWAEFMRTASASL